MNASPTSSCPPRSKAHAIGFVITPPAPQKADDTFEAAQTEQLDRPRRIAPIRLFEFECSKRIASIRSSELRCFQTCVHATLSGGTGKTQHMHSKKAVELLFRDGDNTFEAAHLLFPNGDNTFGAGRLLPGYADDTLKAPQLPFG